ncbi:hypothetical protein D8M03_13700 [Lysinibacillus endophyticus]|uniref:Uncharacterized protein n=1 Tax=Ureibacillus endophyticus TaxID=1978490 RepID=A0A494YWS4_9BACL|nr:hypothetical protein D8M03_13700 [Lysinibacillus endophyticus]
MKKWRNRKRKYKYSNGNYTFFDLVLDVLFIIPEIILWPFRLILWLLRGTGRMIGNFLDFI